MEQLIYSEGNKNSFGNVCCFSVKMQWSGDAACWIFTVL